jgi:branched-subunit amino acid transport protein AzlD
MFYNFEDVLNHFCVQDRGQLDAIIMLLFLFYRSISKFAKEFISMTTFMNCDLLTKFKRRKSLPFLLISMLVVPTYKDSHIFSATILFIEL